MTKRARGALAAACLALALVLCAFLLGAHWRAGAFSTRLSVVPKPLRRTVVAQVAPPEGSVDVNTATADELCTLKGVGPKTAQAIIAEREANGFFDFPQDLLMVKGIGAKTLAKFFDQLDFSMLAKVARWSAPHRTQ